LNAFEITFIQSTLKLKPIVLANVTVQYAQTFTMLLQNWGVISNGLWKILHLFARISNAHSTIQRALVNL